MSVPHGNGQLSTDRFQEINSYLFYLEPTSLESLCNHYGIVKRVFK